VASRRFETIPSKSSLQASSTLNLWRRKWRSQPKPRSRSQRDFVGVNPVHHPSMRGGIYVRTMRSSEAYGRARGEETNIRVQDKEFRHSNGIRHRDVDG